MLKHLFLLLGIAAASAAPAFAQANNFQAQASIKLNTGSETHDPLGLFSDDGDDTKAAGVKSSIVVNMSGAERSAFELINQRRVEAGLSPLTWSDDLAAVARMHSQNMAEFSFFSHRGLDNKLVSDRADLLKIGRWRSIGENIAFNRGYADPVGKAVELWLGSPDHRRNMLDAHWKESAIGVAKAADGSMYFTQVFLIRR